MATMCSLETRFRTVLAIDGAHYFIYPTFSLLQHMYPLNLLPWLLQFTDRVLVLFVEDKAEKALLAHQLKV